MLCRGRVWVLALCIISSRWITVQGRCPLTCHAIGRKHVVSFVRVTLADYAARLSICFIVARAFGASPGRNFIMSIFAKVGHDTRGLRIP